MIKDRPVLFQRFLVPEIVGAATLGQDQDFRLEPGGELLETAGTVVDSLHFDRPAEGDLLPPPIGFQDHVHVPGGTNPPAEVVSPRRLATIDPAMTFRDPGEKNLHGPNLNLNRGESRC
jgi:hypothetical protein